MRRVALIVAAFTALSGFASQSVDRSSPPVDVAGPGGFTIQRLPGRVGIDGRAWMVADVHTGEPAVVTPPGADYQLRFTDRDNSGDFERWSVSFERPGRAPVLLTAGEKTAFAYVTPDARYIYLEPLIVVDVKTWRRYALGDAFGVAPYINIVAIARDDRLFLERSSCSIDCRRRTDEEYFELTPPPGD